MYDIGPDGKLVTWSPMSDLSTVLNLKDSLEIPFPTGKEISFTETNNDEESYNTNSQIISLFIGEDKLFRLIITTNKIKLVLNPNKVRDAIRFITLINNNGILLLTSRVKLKLANDLNLSIELVELLLLEILNIINEHNLYLNNTTAAHSASCANNNSLYNIYQASQDPLNLIQSLSSVDAMTNPLKKKGNKSDSSGDVKTRTPGSFINKIESILDNQVGKTGISICAVGMKTFFGLTGYANKVLNNSNATKEEKRRILINDGKGITIGGKTYYHLANINLKLSAALEDEWLQRLYDAKTEDDAALVLSAMLSLATDKKQKTFQ